MRTSARFTGLAGLLATAALLAAGCSSGQPQPTTSAFGGAATPAGTWAYPNGDAGQHAGRGRVGDLRRQRGLAPGGVVVPPHRHGGGRGARGRRARRQPGGGRRDRVPAGSGRQRLRDLARHRQAAVGVRGNVPEATGPGPDGVAVSGGVVYGDTPTAVFALNASTGAVIWSDNGLLASGQGSFEIQPQVAGGRVYLASAYGSGPGGGVLMALDAASGKLLWKFSTVIGGEAPGVAALGLGSGGAWQTPLVGSDGSVTFGIGNPYQSIGEAITHPTRQLYTDSELNLDAATGKLRWYYQAVPNDFKDHDLQASPIAATVGGVPAIIGGGKIGIVYAMNASTGALLWKTPVGAHNGTDDAWLLLLEHKLTIKLPYTWEPGSLGGVLTNLAVADGSVYAAAINVALKSTTMSSVDGDASGGGDSRRRHRGAEPGHRRGRVGHQGVLAAARRGHGVERPGLHHALQRDADRAQPDDRGDRVPAGAADDHQRAAGRVREHGAGPGGRAGDVGQGRRRRSAAGGVHRGAVVVHPVSPHRRASRPPVRGWVSTSVEPRSVRDDGLDLDLTT